MEHVEPLPDPQALIGMKPEISGADSGQDAPPVWLFGLLVLPYAVYSNGFVNTVVAALLRADGVPLANIPNVVALAILPTSLYFLWSPLVDFWVRRRTWVMAASLVTGLILAGVLQLPNLGTATARVLLFLGMAVVMLTSCGVGGLMAAVVPTHLKTRAAGYFNAGSLGFGALSGGGLLWLSQHMGRRGFGLCCGLVVGLPGLLSLLIDEPVMMDTGDTLSSRLGDMGREFRHTFLKWRSLPVLLMLCSPLGSGAALGLLSGMAPDYGVSMNAVALVNGVAGGLLSALGALLVGYIKLPPDMRPVYAVAGIANALTLGILLLGHPRPITFYLASTLFSLTVGACYALFTGLVLQLLGVSGKSGSSRYAIALSLGNAPVFYMTAVDGLGARWFGLKGLPAIDMVVSGSVAVLFLVYLAWEKRQGWNTSGAP